MSNRRVGFRSEVPTRQRRLLRIKEAIMERERGDRRAWHSPTKSSSPEGTGIQPMEFHAH